MKKLIVILFLLISSFGFSQYFIPFGEDSIYRGSGYHSTVKDIFADDSVLYIVGGSGVQYGGGGVLLNEVGKWDNNSWQSLDNGLGHLGFVYCINKYNNKIYIGGDFPDIQGLGATDHIGRFNGTNWEYVYNSTGMPSSPVYDMVVYNNRLIIGGSFSTIGSIPFSFQYIAAYNDTDYINIGAMPFNVFSVEVFNGELYAGGGWFTLKKYIGGTTWEDVGGNFNYYLQDMIVDSINNFLYVCGGFGIVDDTIPTDNIALWDGFRWSRIGFGTGETNQRTAMAIYRGDLYCNSSIDTIGGVYVGLLAKWDGTSWSPGVPGGIKFNVISLEVFDDMLYIGGGGEIGGTGYCPMDTARKTLARWYLPPDTTCKYLKPRVQTYTDTFYVGIPAQFYNNNAYVQTWAWDFGDSNTASIKDPVHTYNDTGTYNVCVTVNDTGCIKTACKTITILNPTTIAEFNKTSNIKIYPNPTTGKIKIEAEGVESVEVFDLQGQKIPVIARKNDEAILNTQTRLPRYARNDEVDLSSQPKGIYIIKVRTSKAVVVEKIVLD